MSGTKSVTSCFHGVPLEMRPYIRGVSNHSFPLHPILHSPIFFPSIKPFTWSWISTKVPKMQRFSNLSKLSAIFILFSQALALPHISTRTNPKINWGNCTASDPPSDEDFSFLGVACKDWIPTAKSHIDLVFTRQMTNALSPHTRGSSQTYQAQSSCIGWASPPTPAEGLRPRQVAKLPKILLANSFWDPSTPIVWANTLRQELPNSVLVLRNGSGHTSYFSHGKISSAMDAFLLTGELPEQGTVFES